jgi:hypothetical protein
MRRFWPIFVAAAELRVGAIHGIAAAGGEGKGGFLFYSIGFIHPSSSANVVRQPLICGVSSFFLNRRHAKIVVCVERLLLVVFFLFSISSTHTHTQSFILLLLLESSIGDKTEKNPGVREKIWWGVVLVLFSHSRFSSSIILLEFRAAVVLISLIC